MGHRFFAIDGFSRIQGINRHRRMPMFRDSHDDVIDIFPLQQASVVGQRMLRFHECLSLIRARLPTVDNSDREQIVLFTQILDDVQMCGPNHTRSDDSDANPIVGTENLTITFCRPRNGRGQRGGNSGGTGRRQKRSTRNIRRHLDRILFSRKTAVGELPRHCPPVERTLHRSAGGHRNSTTVWELGFSAPGKNGDSSPAFHGSIGHFDQGSRHGRSAFAMAFTYFADDFIKFRDALE